MLTIFKQKDIVKCLASVQTLRVLHLNLDWPDMTGPRSSSIKHATSSVRVSSFTKRRGAISGSSVHRDTPGKRVGDGDTPGKRVGDNNRSDTEV